MKGETIKTLHPKQDNFKLTIHRQTDRQTGRQTDTFTRTHSTRATVRGNINQLEGLVALGATADGTAGHIDPEDVVVRRRLVSCAAHDARVKGALNLAPAPKDVWRTNRIFVKRKRIGATRSPHNQSMASRPIVPNRWRTG